MLLNSSSVQTRMGEFVADRLTSRWGLDVDVERLKVDFPNQAILEGFVVFDPNQDTLISVSSFTIQSKKLIPSVDTYAFRSLKLDGASIHIHAIDTLGTTNFSFLSGSDEINQPDSLKAFLLKGYNLGVDDLALSNCRFVLHDPFRKGRTTGMDFYDLNVSEIDARISDFSLAGDSLVCQIHALSLNEQSGFELTNFRSYTRIDSSGIYAKELQFTTPRTLVIGDIALGHVSWNDYHHFMEEIDWTVDIRESNLNLADIGYFAESLEGRDVDVRFSGKLRGVLEDLKGRKVNLSTGSGTFISGSFDISGMSDIESAFMDIRVKDWRTSYSEIANLTESVFGRNIDNRTFSAQLRRAGALRFKGGFTGFTSDFVANGVLWTDAGKLDMDINLETDTVDQHLVYKGSLTTDKLDVGKLMQIEKLGTVTAAAEVEAHSRKELETFTLDGVIQELQFADYSYHNLTVDGTISDRKFNGQLQSRDPNLNLDFLGTVDFSGKTPLVDFYADVFNMDLTALNLVQTEDHMSFSSRLRLKAVGMELNNTQGKLVAEDSYFCLGDSVLLMDNLQLTAAGDTSNRKVALTSDVADFNITGAFNAEHLPGKLDRIASMVFPSLVDSVQMVAGENFEFSINYKQRNLFSSLLVDGLYVAPNTTAYGSYNSDNEQMGLFFRSNGIGLKQTSFEGISLDLNLQAGKIDGHAFIDKTTISDVLAENLNLDVEGSTDSVLVHASCLNPDNSLRVDIGAVLDVQGRRQMSIELLPGHIGNETMLWEHVETSSIEVDSTSWFVDNLTLVNGTQKLDVHGLITENPADELVVKLNEYNFSQLDSSWVFNRKIEGFLNVEGTVKDFYNDRLVYAQAAVTDLKIGGYSFGDVDASSRYFGDDKRMALNAVLSKDSADALSFRGSYELGAKRPLSGTLRLNDVDLGLLNAFNIPEVSEYSGGAKGEIYVEGDFTHPELNGYVDFNEARFKIDYLNTHFMYSDRVRVEDGWFGIDYKPLYDGFNKKGFVVASAFHDNFKNWSYDVDVETENFFLLNTTREMNDTYYGTAFGSGEIQLGGYDEHLEINIDATTEKGTSIKLPLDESDDVTMENFVYFINPDSTEQQERQIDLQGVEMRLNVDATPDAEIQLIFDEKAGDIIRGRGNGKITLEIAPTGEFLMFGRYEIEEGDYLFTLKSLVNKKFDLRKGGTIGWYGDPYQADVDLSASYLVRTSLYPIMVENQDQYRGRENVNVVLNLKEKLLNPALSFNIELPQSTETERAQLASVVSTTQQLNQQVFSLLILNRFLPVTPSQEEQAVTVTGVGGFGSTTTSDFVSTQISNWLSEISNDFDIGVNYRPGDQITNQEIAVALSTQLFNERLLVSGNFGVTSASELQYTQGQSGILGDFMLEYSLTDEGKIRLKVFNETNPYEVFSTSSSIYTQGVGLIYQEDFDTLDEFFEEVKGLFSKDKVKKAPDPNP